MCAVRRRHSRGAAARQVERRNYRLQDIQLSTLLRAFACDDRLRVSSLNRKLEQQCRFFDIVWDDLRSPRRMARPAENPRHQSTIAIGNATATPVAIATFPVVIGEGSHPFPFRTRKLSPLPPMVLRGKLRGRVGHCRDYLSSPSSDSGDGLFLCQLSTYVISEIRAQSRTAACPKEPTGEREHGRQNIYAELAGKQRRPC